MQSAVGAVSALLGLSLLVSAEGAAQIVAHAVPMRGQRGETRYPVPAADGVSIDKANDVIIARAGDHAYAFSLACPHQNTALRWYAADHRFECPKHKSRFSPVGELIEGKATRNMDRLPVRLESGELVVDTSREIRSDKELDKWAAAVVRVCGFQGVKGFKGSDPLIDFKGSESLIEGFQRVRVLRRAAGLTSFNDSDPLKQRL